MSIKQAPDEFSGNENIPDAPLTFKGVTSSSHNYVGGIRDISILPLRAEQKVAPLTEDEQFTLRSQFGGINVDFSNCETGELYDASVSAQTFETIDETIIYTGDFEEVPEVSSTKVFGTPAHPHIPGFGGFSRKFPMGANRANLANRI